MSDLLLVDDLMLLLMDDDGASIQGAATLHYTLGGAVLTELALLGRVQTDESGVLNGPRVTPAGDGPLPDPLLQSAYEKVAAKTQRVQPLILDLGSGLWRDIIARLADRGLVERKSSRFLGLFRTTSWPATDDPYEESLRTRIKGVLEHDNAPDARTAALIALLSASGAMPSLRPPLPWTSKTATRALEFQRGEWGPEAVSTALTRTAVAIAVASAAASVATAVAVARK